VLGEEGEPVSLDEYLIVTLKSPQQVFQLTVGVSQSEAVTVPVKMDLIKPFTTVPEYVFVAGYLFSDQPLATVVWIMPTSPADKHGIIQVGQVLASVNGRPVFYIAELRQLIGTLTDLRIETRDGIVDIVTEDERANGEYLKLADRFDIIKRSM
jgi:S1-C subfamily serine protease